jgi:hypothetical protein
MGAVLMLLGELGFVGIFIGGGSRVAMGDIDSEQVLTLAEVPEWGAMLAEGFRFLRTKPFVVIPPAAAFFIAVMGFNLLGEGLRRLVEQNSLNTAFLLRKRMVLVVLGISLATIFIVNNTGAAPWFAKVAQGFDGARAYNFVKDLSGMNGRAVWQDGGAQAAGYIADQFAGYGLQPGWKGRSYFYTYETRIVHPLAQPEFSLLDEYGKVLGSFRHQVDFGFVISENGGSGDVDGPLTFIGFRSPGSNINWSDYAGLDLRGQVALVFEEEMPAGFISEAFIRGAQGIILLAGEQAEPIHSQIQLADPDQFYLRQPNIPVFRVRWGAAETAFSNAGLDLRALSDPGGEDLLAQSGWVTRNLNMKAHLSLSLSQPETVLVRSVLAYAPGSDFDLADELVVLFAPYDGLGEDPDGSVFPSANRSASGVGVLLEMARLWQEQSLNPRRSVMFVAWGGWELEDSGARAFFADEWNFRHLPTQAINQRVRPEMLIHLEGLGAGGDELIVHPNSSPRLVDLWKDVASGHKLVVIEPQSGENTSLGVSRSSLWSVKSWIYFRRSGLPVNPLQDQFDRIQPEKLDAVGKSLTLALTRTVRETNY